MKNFAQKLSSTHLSLEKAPIKIKNLVNMFCWGGQYSREKAKCKSLLNKGPKMLVYTYSAGLGSKMTNRWLENQ